MLVSLLRVSLRDRHPTERASPLIFLSPSPPRANRRSGVLLTRTRASDEIIRARLSRRSSSHDLKFALRSSSPPRTCTPRSPSHRSPFAAPRRTRPDRRACETETVSRPPCVRFLLNVVHDVPVARQPARLSHESYRGVRDGVRDDPSSGGVTPAPGASRARQSRVARRARDRRVASTASAEKVQRVDANRVALARAARRDGDAQTHRIKTPGARGL